MVENKTDLFLSAREKDLTLALELFKLYKNDFKKENDFLSYDNYIDNSVYDDWFTQESKINRFYQAVKCSNNLEAITALMLDQSLSYTTHDFRLDFLDYLLENKSELNIKDEIIVQFFVEKPYELEAACVSRPEDVDVFKDNLLKIILKLIEYGVSFESDIQGYLIQIVGFNQVKDEQKILFMISENGSNIANFLSRYEDSNNWLSKEQEKELFYFDGNHDRQYNIYKKFDDINTISNETINTCKTIDGINKSKAMISSSLNSHIKVSSSSKAKMKV